jgi:4-amino-4-deoxy-L-arabinose transferase-like glycosyltransferase
VVDPPLAVLHDDVTDRGPDDAGPPPDERASAGTDERRSTWRSDVLSSARRWWPLLVIVGVALVLRLSVAVAPLPYGHHPDEPRNLNAAASMARESSLNYEAFSGHMSYPGLMYNVGAGTFRSWAVVADLAGNQDSLQREPFVIQTPGNARSDNSSAVLAMRLPLLVSSLATVVLAAALAYSITRRREIAYLAASFVALSAVDIELGGTFTPDPATGAFNSAVLLGSVWLLQRGSLLRYVIVGALVGLAVSTKYSGVLVAVAVVVAHLIRTNGRPWRDIGWLAASGVTSVAVFAVVSPATFLEWDTAWSWIQLEQEHYRTGHPGWEGGVPAYYAGALFRMFGPALLLVPAAFLIPRRARRFVLPIVAFVGVYLVVHLMYVARFERFMMALTGALAVLIALAVHGILRRLPELHHAVTAAAVVALLAVPAVMATTTIVRAHQDPWSEARTWIDENVPENSTIAVDSFGAWVDPGRFVVHAGGALSNTSLEEHRSFGVQYFVTAAAQYDRYDPDRYPEQYAAYRELLAGTCELASFTGNNHTVVVLSADPC